MKSEDIPRRNRLDLSTPAELAIRAAMQAVELAGCDVRLTDAINLLSAAREKVADFVDSVESKTPIETAWLVEFNICVAGRVQYWGKTIEGLGLTPENLDALRFARKQDAEAFIADNGWTEVKATEHQWG